MEKLLRDIETKAKKHGIRVIIEDSPVVCSPLDKTRCAGYFCEEEMVIKIGRQKTLNDTIGLLAHESSHMDQWIQDKYIWNKLNVSYQLFFNWLENKAIVKREHLEEAVQDIIRLEKDCEQRAVKKMLRYGIKLDYDKYKRKANAYLYAYLFFLEKKLWIPKIYENKEVWTLAPSRFPKIHKKIPQRLYKKFIKVFNAI